MDWRLRVLWFTWVLKLLGFFYHSPIDYRGPLLGKSIMSSCVQPICSVVWNESAKQRSN